MPLIEAKWKTPDAKTLGLPVPSKEAYFGIEGTVMPWIPYMAAPAKLNVDWFMVMRRRTEIQAYIDAGGDPKRCIVHHMFYDQGVIEPLWSPSKFQSWVKELRDWGIEHIWPPDFSTFLNWPIPEQIHNLYRTAVVTCDFANAGFKILPYYYIINPIMEDTLFSMLPADVHTAMIDGSHCSSTVKTGTFLPRMFRDFAGEFSRRVTARRVLVWARTPKAAIAFRECNRGQGEWLMNRMVVRDKLCKAIAASRKPPAA